MNTPAFFLSVVLLIGATPGLAQETKTSSVTQLIEQLGDTEYRARKAAEKALVALGDRAIAGLEKSAKGHPDPEVQWRAGRILDQIKASSSATKGKGGLKKRPESKPPVEQKGKTAPAPGVLKPRTSRSKVRSPFEGLEGQFGSGGLDQEMRRLIDQLRNGMGRLDGVSVPRASTGRSIRVQQGPDGVEVEVTEQGEGGKPETKVYKAEDMETFKKKYPGVLGGAVPGRGLRPFRGLDLELFEGGLPRLRSGLRSRMPQVPTPSTRDRSLRKRGGEPEQVEAQGPKLGVYIAELDPAVRDYLDLRSGMMIQEVVPNSLADKLGVEKKDILLKVSGRDVRSAEDVAAGLAQGASTPVVEILRRGRPLTLGGAQGRGAEGRSGQGASKTPTPKRPKRK